MHKIGSWHFHSEAAVLRKRDIEKSLEDRSARVLEILCRRRGEIVSKDELLAEVWQGRNVSPNSVAIVISDLRRALDDSPSEPTHIITVGRRGYRLALAAEGIAHASSHGRRWALSLALATALVLAGATLIERKALEPRPIEMVVVPTLNETGRPQYDGLARSLTAVLTDRAVRFHGLRVLSSDDPARVHAHRILLKSRLIIWNGAPELAMTATDVSNHLVLWSAFATGGSGNLAREAATSLDALQGRLPPAST